MTGCGRPVAHPLASRPGLGLADLMDAPEVAVPLPSLRRATGARDGFRPSLTCEGGDLGPLVDLVAAGHGLALLPAGLAAGHPGLAEVPVREPRIVHRTELLHPRTTDRASASFIAALP